VICLPLSLFRQLHCWAPELLDELLRVQITHAYLQQMAPFGAGATTDLDQSEYQVEINLTLFK
jgi:hypothetical protein